LCFGDDVYTLVSVCHGVHGVHEFKIARILIGDDPRAGRPPLDDVDAAILKRLLEALFSSLRTLSEDLHIPRVTVWEHTTKYLSLQCHHFKWVCQFTYKSAKHVSLTFLLASRNFLVPSDCGTFPQSRQISCVIHYPDVDHHNFNNNPYNFANQTLSTGLTSNLSCPI
jgi:hypothetical protein